MTDEQWRWLRQEVFEIERHTRLAAHDSRWSVLLKIAILGVLITLTAVVAKPAPITSNPTSIEYDDCGGWAPSQLKYEPGQITWWAADCSVGWHTAELNWSYTIWGGEMATHLPVSATFAADHSLGRPYLIGLDYARSLTINGEAFAVSVDLGGWSWWMHPSRADVFIPVDLRLTKTDIPEPAGAVPLAIILAAFVAWRRRR